MQSEQVHIGRTFVLRLEHGDIIHECIESFAREQGITAATLIILGGAETGSKLVVGPKDGQASPVTPMQHILDNVHEVTGTGTIFPDQEKQPVLHMHLACGRQDRTATGCIRAGVRVWQVMEAVLFELTGSQGQRMLDPSFGFQLLRLATS